MADEPNNRMDEALKAYATKRRQDASAPFELHPATRRMLQGEVVQTYRQAVRVSWLQRLITFWPRLAFASACVVITLALVLLLLPRPTVTQMAQTTSRDAAPAETEKADTFLFDNAAPRSSTAPVPAQEPMQDVAKRSEADALKAEREIATVEARKDANQVRLADNNLTAAKPAARAAFVNTNQVSLGRYKQLDEEAQLGVRLQNAPAILNNFEIVQTGEGVSVIDEDGSVYSGKLISQDEAKQRYFRFQAPSAPSTAGATAQTQTAFFAVGTNRSLKQQVSIEGNILQLQTNAVPALAAPDVRQNERLVRQTISGRARVGTNQEVLIRAISVQP